MKAYYVYAHFTKDTNECFYIGVGADNRAYQRARNNYWHNIVNKHGYRVEIVSYFSTRDGAERIEHMLQNFFKPRACFQYGDRKGSTISEKTRQKLSDSHLGQKPWNIGIPMSEAAKVKCRAANLGQKAWNKNIPMSQESIEKLRQANLGKKQSKETIDKRSKKIRKAIVNCRGEIFESLTEAITSVNLKSTTSLTRCLRGTTKTSGKYPDGTRASWSYYEYKKI